jgi:hypothetical protein
MKFAVSILALLSAAAVARAGDGYEVTSNFPAAYTVVSRLPKGCVCGGDDKCKCKDGDCPAKCPTAVPPKGLPPARAGFHWVRDNRSPIGWGLCDDASLNKDLSKIPVQGAASPPQQQSCPTGTCPLRKP